MEEERIKAIRYWLKPQLRFSKLVALITSVLKTTPADGLAASANIRDEKQDGKRIQIEN